MNTIKYKFVDNHSNKLILAINDMGATNNEENIFSPYTSFIKMFPEYDLLFIKETKPQYWYLDNIDAIKTEINKYAVKYADVYLITSSSGGIVTLHILPDIINLKCAILINIQTYLDKEHLDQYNDIAHIDENKIGHLVHLFYPINAFPRTCKIKIRYYTGYINSDKDYCEHLEKLNFPQIEIIKDTACLNHAEYIIKIFKIADDNNFYAETRSFFS